MVLQRYKGSGGVDGYAIKNRLLQHHIPANLSVKRSFSLKLTLDNIIMKEGKTVTRVREGGKEGKRGGGGGGEKEGEEERRGRSSGSDVMAGNLNPV